MLRRVKHIAIGSALLAVAAVFAAPAAQAHDRVGFSLSIGGPGYAVAVGNAPYWGYRPYYHHRHWRPAYVAPPVVYAPPVYYAPPPRVVYRYRAPVVVRERYYYYDY
jgi:hypothetical protein